MAFFQIPNPWNPGYALPDYVLAEPPGRGTFTTAMIPRRTVDVLPPDYLAQPAVAGGGNGVEARTSVTGSGTSLSGHTLDKSTLSGSTLSKPTLSGSTLGRKAKASRYVVQPAAVGADLPGGNTLPLLAAAAAVVWLLTRKKSGSATGWTGPRTTGGSRVAVGQTEAQIRRARARTRARLGRR